MRAFLLLLSLAASALGAPADRVVAVVDEELVLLSEVALDAALTPHDTTALPFWTLPRQAPEDKLVEAAMIRASAGDLALYRPTDEEVRRRLQAVRDGMPGTAAWRAFLATWHVTEDDLGAHLRQRMIVERYLLRTLQVAPEDPGWWGEVRRLLEELRARTRVRRIPEQ